MTYRLPFAFFCMAGFAVLSGCASGPRQHTVIDYDSLEPEIGHGADYDEQTRYGRVSTRDSRTGFDRPDYDQRYPPDDEPLPESDSEPDDTQD